MRRVLMYCLVFMLCLTACAPHPGFIGLSTAPEIQDYVREQYGGADMLRYELSDYSNIYYLKDNVYGFEYYVGCYLEPIKLDNTIMGYHEVKRSNYEVKYLETLWSKIDDSVLPDGVHAVFNQAVSAEKSLILGYIIVNSELETDEGMRASMILGSQLRNLDTRRLLPSYVLVVRDRHENIIGRFEFDGGKNIAEEFVMQSVYCRNAQDILRSEDVEMCYIERMLFDDVPGLNQEILFQEVGPENEVVLLYYFLHNHQRYFLADVKVMYDEVPHYYVYNVTESHSMTSILHPYVPDLGR